MTLEHRLGMKRTEKEESPGLSKQFRPPSAVFMLGFGMIALTFVGAGLVGGVLSNSYLTKIGFFAYMVFRTLSRMTLAYGLSLAFALTYGITTAMSHRASHVLLPLLDILQSVPVLGFLPVVFIFFTTSLPGTLGLEVSSIILIFTAMVWAPTFGVIAGINAIPQDIKEASQAYGVKGIRYLRHVVLPAVFPELVWSSLLAWGGGWYLIPVEEYFTFAGTTHQLPGIGYYIAKSAADQKLASSLFGLGLLVFTIIMIDEFVWKPLGTRAEKYKYESVAAAQTPGTKRSRVSANVRKYEERLVSPIFSFLRYERASLASFLEAVHLRRRLHLSDKIKVQDRIASHVLLGRMISIVIAFSLILVSIPLLRGIQLRSFSDALQTIHANVGFFVLLLDTSASLLRILTAYLIALAWTLGAGILIARSDRLSKLLVPIFDVGQSIPATALFPIIILLVVNPFRSNPLALNFASILLLLTGMQWYLLFNIVGAVRSLPTDILEASAAYDIKGRRFIKGILVPASYPAILIGTIQAWGGGWNATIVSEYVVDPTNPSTPHTVPGLGSLLQTAANLPDPYVSTVIITAAIVLMTATVLSINRLVWRRLLKKAEKYKLES